MRMLQRIAPLRAVTARWATADHRVGLVPTMGNLHAGHLSLVERARALSDRVVVSLFVNPTQFGENEDFQGYPRTFEEDSDKLAAAGCDLLFAPGVEEVYPYGPGGATRMRVPGLSETLCGAARPGHFDGVATVVVRLLQMVQPRVAVFGEKDFQQLTIIQRLIKDLAIPVKIVGAATVREPDGLAMSSRNAYLSPQERQRAPALYRALHEAARAVAAGQSPSGVEAGARAALEAAGFRVDYVAVRRESDLAPPDPGDAPLRVFGAGWLGQARLIDNVPVAA